MLAIDIAVNFDTVTAGTASSGLPDTGGRIAFYLFLRFTYNLPAIIPLAGGIGIIWAEWTLARGYERAMIQNTGRATLVSLFPALLLGLALGTVQVAALTILRPLSVEAHAVHEFRTWYGPRLSGLGPQQRWIAIEESIVRAQVDFRSDPPGMSEITVFRLGPDLRLTEVIVAGSGAFDGSNLRLEAPETWGSAPSDAAAEPAAIALHPVWLRNMGLEPRFWTQSDLATVASARDGVPQQHLYRAVLQSRLAGLMRLVAICVLVAALCFALIRPRPGIIVGLWLAGAGYAVHFVTQMLTTLGKYGHLPGTLAFWVLPSILLCLVFIIRAREAARVSKLIAQRPDRMRLGS